MEGILALLIPIVAIICVFAVPVVVIGYVIIRTTGSSNKERMELARHGIVPPDRKKPAPNKYRSLRNGYLCIGLALGLIAGIITIVNSVFNPDIQFLIVSASTLLFLGIAYVLFYITVKDKKEIEDEIE